MKITTNRFEKGSNWTRSLLAVDGVPQCKILELPVTPLVAGGIFAIPAGTYRVIINQSTRFSARAGHPVFLMLLLDLPGHTTLFHGKPINDCGIRLHGGNVVNSIPVGHPGGPNPGPYNVNDAKRTDSDACLLAGTAWGADGKSTTGSQAALAPLQAKVQAALNRGEAVTLTIS